DYRLLSEAEFEYAARAGSTKAYPWGDAVGKGNANCNGCGSQWDGKQTSPVDALGPNSFGLYDMHGNVWQFTEDPWHEDYTDAPTDGSVWVKDGDPDRRVERGGAWFDDRLSIRSANRDWIIMVSRYPYLG